MTRLDTLRQSLYTICRYDYDTKDYIRYNQLLWADIQKLDIEAVEEAIKQLIQASHDDVRSERLTRECNQ